jgi:hypothetical protein
MDLITNELFFQTNDNVLQELSSETVDVEKLDVESRQCLKEFQASFLEFQKASDELKTFKPDIEETSDSVVAMAEEDDQLVVAYTNVHQKLVECRIKCFSALGCSINCFLRDSHIAQRNLLVQIIGVMCVFGNRENLNWDEFGSTFLEMYGRHLRSQIYRYYTFTKLKRKLSQRKLAGTLDVHIAIHEKAYKDATDLPFPQPSPAELGGKPERVPEAVAKINNKNNTAMGRVMKFVKCFLEFVFSCDRVWQIVSDRLSKTVAFQPRAVKNPLTPIDFASLAKYDEVVVPPPKLTNKQMESLQMAVAQEAAKYATEKYRPRVKQVAEDEVTAVKNGFHTSDGETDEDDVPATVGVSKKAATTTKTGAGGGKRGGGKRGGGKGAGAGGKPRGDKQAADKEAAEKGAGKGAADKEGEIHFINQFNIDFELIF